MTAKWDAIVIGARCAGSPTAMLLARQGYRVLVVDRATFPSDALSTHMVHPRGVAALERWGILDRLRATGCPIIDKYTYNFGSISISGSPGTATAPFGLCPRRTILDEILVDAAVECGAEVREGFKVDEILMQDGRVVGIKGGSPGGQTVTEYADVVIGADGRRSLLGATVGAQAYNERTAPQVSYYTYYRDMPTDGFEIYIHPYRGWAMMPTHDGLSLVVVTLPIREFDRYRKDVEGTFARSFELDPRFAARICKATRVDRFYGGSVPGYFRKQFGPGWALVGDAAYNKDFITAMGITDAFLSAERCTEALCEVMSGASNAEEVFAACQRRRDEECQPMYELTYQFAAMDPTPPELMTFLSAVSGNARAMTDFVKVTSGMLSPLEFFSEDNVRSILSDVADRPTLKPAALDERQSATSVLAGGA